MNKIAFASFTYSVRQVALFFWKDAICLHGERHQYYTAVAAWRITDNIAQISEFSRCFNGTLVYLT